MLAPGRYGKRRMSLISATPDQAQQDGGIMEYDITIDG